MEGGGGAALSFLDTGTGRFGLFEGVEVELFRLGLAWVPMVGRVAGLGLS